MFHTKIRLCSLLMILLLTISCTRSAWYPLVSSQSHRPIPPHTALLSTGDPLIIIDPGHGGDDPGAISWNRQYEEEDITLTAAFMLQKQLHSLGYRAILTRRKDCNMPLKKRTNIANANNATIFVSIHCNSSYNIKAKGVEVYYFPKSTRSRRLAQAILGKIIHYTKTRSRGIKTAHFTVLQYTKMPAVLVELGFLSSPEDLDRLNDPEYLNVMAWGIAKGIDQYLD